MSCVITTLLKALIGFLSARPSFSPLYPCLCLWEEPVADGVVATVTGVWCRSVHSKTPCGGAGFEPAPKTNNKNLKEKHRSCHGSEASGRCARSQCVCVCVAGMLAAWCTTV